MNAIEQYTLNAVDVARGLKLIKRPASFKRALVINKGRAFGRCTGGVNGSKKPVITYGTRWWHWDGAADLDLKEYARIRQDPEIGSTAQGAQAIACHELAHAIVLWNWYQMPYKDRRNDRYPDAHGGEWRRTYRALRRAMGLTQQQAAA